MTPGEETAQLDRELDQSLRDFDEMLTREKQAQQARREAATGVPSGGGSGGYGSSGGGSQGGSAGEGASGAESGDQAGSTASSEQTGDPGYSGGGAVAGPDGRGRPAEGEGDDQEASSGDRDVPSDVGDGSDDDIVARQIREAAVKEEDPELREKLWDEYRAYKQGKSASDS